MADMTLNKEPQSINSTRVRYLPTVAWQQEDNTLCGRSTVLAAFIGYLGASDSPKTLEKVYTIAEKWWARRENRVEETINGSSITVGTDIYNLALLIQTLGNQLGLQLEVGVFLSGRSMAELDRGIGEENRLRGDKVEHIRHPSASISRYLRREKVWEDNSPHASGGAAFSTEELSVEEIKKRVQNGEYVIINSRDHWLLAFGIEEETSGTGTKESLVLMNPESAVNKEGKSQVLKKSSMEFNSRYLSEGKFPAISLKFNPAPKMQEKALDQ